AAALSGVPHRALALHAPGSVRCALRFAHEVRLRTAVGLQGAGEAEAEIRVLRDGKKPEVIRTIHLEGGDKTTWTDIELPLEAFVPGVGAVELAATKAPKGGRVLFGDPAIVLPVRDGGSAGSADSAGTAPKPPAASTSPPPARAVVIVVLD